MDCGIHQYLHSNHIYFPLWPLKPFSPFISSELCWSSAGGQRVCEWQEGWGEGGLCDKAPRCSGKAAAYDLLQMCAALHLIQMSYWRCSHLLLKLFHCVLFLLGKKPTPGLRSDCNSFFIFEHQLSHQLRTPVKSQVLK